MMGLFNNTSKAKAIKRVKLLGQREAHETLLISTVNFTLYSFWVEYADGTTETIECSPTNPNDKKKKEKSLFDKLMGLANADPTTSNPTVISSGEVLDDLRKLNELHTSGVIPDDLYEVKRGELLEQLSRKEESIDKTNVTIDRAEKRAFGEAELFAIIDGQRLEEGLDAPIQLSLPAGCHTIQFQRMLYKTKALQFNIENGKHYTVLATKGISLGIKLRED